MRQHSAEIHPHLHRLRVQLDQFVIFCDGGFIVAALLRSDGFAKELCGIRLLRRKHARGDKD